MNASREVLQLQDFSFDAGHVRFVILDKTQDVLRSA